VRAPDGLQTQMTTIPAKARSEDTAREGRKRAAIDIPTRRSHGVKKGPKTQRREKKVDIARLVRDEMR